jgi:hypothetical protein
VSQEAAPSASVPDRTTSYKGVVPTNEAVPGGNLLVIAYILVFLVVLLMIVRVFQRQTVVAKKLDELEADLRKKK